jgi:UDP-3-O-[3-hydroxymyristoyl] glucosamine N-acyltransferase
MTTQDTHPPHAATTPAQLPPAPWRASLLASVVGATRVVGECTIHALDSLETAGPHSLSFARDERSAHTWLAGKGGALLVAERTWNKACEGAPALDESSRCVLLVPDADLALIAILERLPTPAPRPAAGVHPAAVVHPLASVAGSASIGPGCIIEADAHVGEGSVLVAQCYVGVGARVGDRCLLHPGVRVLARCVVGNACQLHAGVVLGADGFGYRPDATCAGGLRKVPHVGNVVVGDFVEIGANSCVDRGKLGATTIGSGTKIDNLVQIAHNCAIGRSCIICGNVGLAGSVSLGDGVVLGGSVNVRDGVHIASRAQIAATSAVAHNVPAGETWIGSPAQPVAQWNASFKALLRLAKLGRGVGKRST